MKMIERVAMAIYSKYEHRPRYAKVQMNAVLAEELAHAAISAMINASATMAEEGADAVNPYTDNAKEYSDNVEIALDVYQAMIRAALEEGK